ncbi:MAG: PilZ domain-containing protein [Magnetococcales bacterium]|nr:PilZ domain-containing protein [Magnetococcales bacterium]
MEKGVKKQVDVLGTLQKAVSENALLEVVIEGEEKRYGARLLEITDTEQMKKMAANAILNRFAAGVKTQSEAEPGEKQEDTRWIRITPLEPTDGNMKIRKANKVILSFYLGLEYYRTVVAFQRVLRMEAGQAIELSWPPAIISSPKRQQIRVDIPEEIFLEVQVQKKGSEPFMARVVDLSSGGLSFACQESSTLLEIGDKVGLAVRGEILMGTPIVTYGSVMTMARARDPKEIDVTWLRYGVQFKLLSVADAMTVDRLVETVLTGGKSGMRMDRKKTT